MRNLFRYVGAFALVLMLAACGKVPAGNVGVKVDLYGNSRGVQQQVLGPGRYYVGWNQELYLFPTFTQNYTWTKDPREGSPTDESISFQSGQGMTLNADVGITYHLERDKIPQIFQKYRSGVNEITHSYLHNIVRNAFTDQASELDVEQIYGAGKTKFIKSVLDEVRSQVGPIGINVENIYLVGSLRLPRQVEASINAKIQATQDAQRAENQVAQAKAEAQKEVAIAAGHAQAKIEVAKADAEAIEIKGKALRDNPLVLKLNAISKWDGQLPTYIGGSAPVPFVDVSQSSTTSK